MNSKIYLLFIAVLISNSISVKAEKNKQIGIAFKEIPIWMSIKKEKKIGSFYRGDFFNIEKEIILDKYQNENRRVFYKIKKGKKSGYILFKNSYEKYFLGIANLTIKDKSSIYPNINESIRKILLLDELSHHFNGYFSSDKNVKSAIWSLFQDQYRSFTITSPMGDYSQDYYKIKKIGKDTYHFENDKTEILLSKKENYFLIKVLKNQGAKELFPVKEFSIYRSLHPGYTLKGPTLVTVEKANVRAVANSKAKVLFQLKKGDEVEVLATTGYEKIYNMFSPWAKIRDSKGRTGYIWGGLLK